MNFARHLYATRVNYGDPGSCPVDQTSSKEFNIDPSTGRPMSAIDKVIKANSEVEMQAMFAALPEIATQFKDSNMSNEEILKFAFPRHCQLPSEIAKLNGEFTKIRMADLDAQRKQQLQKEFEDSLKN